MVSSLLSASAISGSGSRGHAIYACLLNGQALKRGSAKGWGRVLQRGDPLGPSLTPQSQARESLTGQGVSTSTEMGAMEECLLLFCTQASETHLEKEEQTQDSEFSSPHPASGMQEQSFKRL